VCCTYWQHVQSIPVHFLNNIPPNKALAHCHRYLDVLGESSFLSHSVINNGEGVGGVNEGQTQGVVTVQRGGAMRPRQASVAGVQEPSICSTTRSNWYHTRAREVRKIRTPGRRNACLEVRGCEADHARQVSTFGKAANVTTYWRTGFRVLPQQPTHRYRWRTRSPSG
jgi:hypothetical protein